MLLLPMAHYNLLVAIASIVLLAVGTKAESAGGIGFNLHHRFSPVVRQWMEARAGHGHAPGGASWLPEGGAPKGSPEYYSALLRHDRARRLATLRRRGLASAADGQQSTLIFADGNATRLDLHTYLYYAEVEVGTPRSKFLVALDTGSDLFWLPCSKTTTAGGNTNTTDTDTESPAYSPSQSSTSKAVPCDDPLCYGGGCDAAGSCTYNLTYADYTGSSGVVVEDVLHLTADTGGGAAGTKAVQAPIVLGCGQVKTTVDGGTMGLSRGNVSVPTALASSGLVASDSFSMCFSRDGAGRINFGDAGSPDQAETPFITTGTSESLQSTFYSISVAAITVDSKAMPVEFTAVVDSGSSYTQLADPAYTLLTAKFNSGVYEPTAFFGGVFDYCYSLSPGQTKLKRLPEVSLTTKGGAVFPITWPIVPVLSDEADPQIMGYCLGIKRSISIGSSTDYVIGEKNFMTGLKVVFDRKRSVLGWEKFDCYKNAKMEDGGSPDTSVGSSGDSAPAPGSSGDTAPVGSPDYAPYAPLPWENNATGDGPYPHGDGPVPLPLPASSGSGLGSSSRGFGGILTSILLSVLVLASMA